MARGRPKQALLSTERIVDTALRQIDAGSQLNMSSIARELSVHVSSLYNHVEDRTALIELLRLRIAAEHPVPSLTGLGWQDALRAVATTIHTAFAAHPNLIPYLAATPVSSPEIVSIYVHLAEAMVAAGHPAARVLIAIRTIDMLALGTALVHSSEAVAWPDDSPGGRALRTGSATWVDDRDLTAEAYTHSLDALIAGFEHDLARETA